MSEEMKIDEVIHQPVRTRVLALLINSGETDYTSIKKGLKLSDGHMTTHMRVLLREDYVSMKKEFVNNRPKTTYKVTDKGKKKFKEYLEVLREIVSAG